MSADLSSLLQHATKRRRSVGPDILPQERPEVPPPMEQNDDLATTLINAVSRGASAKLGSTGETAEALPNIGRQPIDFSLTPKPVDPGFTFGGEREAALEGGRRAFTAQNIPVSDSLPPQQMGVRPDALSGLIGADAPAIPAPRSYNEELSHAAMRSSFENMPAPASLPSALPVPNPDLAPQLGYDLKGRPVRADRGEDTDSEYLKRLEGYKPSDHNGRGKSMGLGAARGGLAGAQHGPYGALAGAVTGLILGGVHPGLDEELHNEYEKAAVGKRVDSQEKRKDAALDRQYKQAQIQNIQTDNDTQKQKIFLAHMEALMKGEEWTPEVVNGKVYKKHKDGRFEPLIDKTTGSQFIELTRAPVNVDGFNVTPDKALEHGSAAGKAQMVADNKYQSDMQAHGTKVAELNARASAAKQQAEAAGRQLISLQTQIKDRGTGAYPEETNEIARLSGEIRDKEAEAARYSQEASALPKPVKPSAQQSPTMTGQRTIRTEAEWRAIAAQTPGADPDELVRRARAAGQVKD